MWIRGSAWVTRITLGAGSTRAVPGVLLQRCLPCWSPLLFSWCSCHRGRRRHCRKNRGGGGRIAAPSPTPLPEISKQWARGTPSGRDSYRPFPRQDIMDGGLNAHAKRDGPRCCDRSVDWQSSGSCFFSSLNSPAHTRTGVYNTCTRACTQHAIKVGTHLVQLFDALLEGVVLLAILPVLLIAQLCLTPCEGGLLLHEILNSNSGAATFVGGRAAGTGEHRRRVWCRTVAYVQPPIQWPRVFCTPLCMLPGRGVRDVETGKSFEKGKTERETRSTICENAERGTGKKKHGSRSAGSRGKPPVAETHNRVHLSTYPPLNAAQT